MMGRGYCQDTMVKPDTLRRLSGEVSDHIADTLHCIRLPRSKILTGLRSSSSLRFGAAGGASGYTEFDPLPI